MMVFYSRGWEISRRVNNSAIRTREVTMRGYVRKKTIDELTRKAVITIGAEFGFDFETENNYGSNVGKAFPEFYGTRCTGFALSWCEPYTDDNKAVFFDFRKDNINNVLDLNFNELLINDMDLAQNDVEIDFTNISPKEKIPLEADKKSSTFAT